MEFSVGRLTIFSFNLFRTTGRTHRTRPISLIRAVMSLAISAKRGPMADERLYISNRAIHTNGLQDLLDLSHPPFCLGVSGCAESYDFNKDEK